MRVPMHPNKPWELTQTDIELVKQQICKGATDVELRFCLAVAKRRKLDPIRGQIWFVPRKNGDVKQWVPITGIDGLLHIAARDHKDFGSNDEPEYGPMKEIKWQYFQKSGKFMAPEWARVKLWKKGHEHPIVATVYWDEVYPEVGASPLVRQMPRLMLGKCALAQAVRRAYPATDGLYIREEFQGPPQYTDTGREIVYPEAKQTEAESNWEKREKEGLEHLTPAQRDIVERKMKEAEKPQPAKAQEPQILKVTIMKFPAKDDGDVELHCHESTAETLKLKRRGADADSWLIKASSLVKFHDLCREQGVEVEDGTNG